MAKIHVMLSGASLARVLDTADVIECFEYNHVTKETRHLARIIATGEVGEVIEHVAK